MNMKTIFALIALSLAGCSSNPPAPCDQQCQSMQQREADRMVYEEARRVMNGTRWPDGRVRKAPGNP
jgi:hypothetical protein